MGSTAQIRSGSVPAHFRAGPIANVMKAILKLLARDGRVIRPFALARNDLAQRVVKVNPV